MKDERSTARSTGPMAIAEDLFKASRDVLVSGLSVAAKHDLLLRGYIAIQWKSTFPSFKPDVEWGMEPDFKNLWNWWMAACEFLGRDPYDAQVADRLGVPQEITRPTYA